MINTIFYFPLSKADYTSAYNSGDIADRTICFVPDEKAIYKDGIRYGSTSLDDLKEQIQQIFTENPYILPIATSSRLGGVMIGDGFKINETTGKLDVDFSSFSSVTDGHNGMDGLIKTIFDSVTNIRASKNSYGIVKIADNGGIAVNDGVIGVDINYIKSQIPSSEISGSNVTVDQLLSTGTEIARITINGIPTILYAPTSSGGGSSSGGGNTTYVENPYDDAWIRSKFGSMEGRIDNAESNIHNILNETDDEIREKFKNAFDTYKSLIDYYISTGDNTYSNYTFGNDDCDVWASTRGLVTKNNDGTYTVGWSSLQQSYDSISAEVTRIKGQIGSGGGEVNYEMLASGLYSYIQDNYTTAGLSSTWAKFMKLSDEDIVRLEWMSSGVQTYASDSQTFANLMAAAQEYDSDGKTKLQEAYSGITALVEKDGNGRYVAKTTLTSLVDDSISGIITENSSNSAVADLFARINDVETETSYISGLTTEVEKLKDGDYITSSILASKIGSMTDHDKNVAFASLATKASLNEVESAMTASLEDVNSSIALCVKKDSNGKIESEAKIDADNVIINADHKIALTADNFTIDGAVLVAKLGSAKITATNLDLTGVSFTVNADDINLNGQTNFINSIGNSITVKKVVTNNTILDDSIFGGILVGDVTDSSYNPALSIGHIGSSRSWVIASGGTKIAAFTGDGIYFGQSSAAPATMSYTTHRYAHDGWSIKSSSNDDLSMETSFSDTDAALYIHGSEGSTRYSNTGVTESSDIRLKTILSDEIVDIQNISDAPLFKYKHINSTSDKVFVGTSAQYWKDVVPEAVIEDDNGFLMLNYTTVATVSAITAAKEVAALKAENTSLVERVEALEARLQVIENKLNA